MSGYVVQMTNLETLEGPQHAHFQNLRYMLWQSLQQVVSKLIMQPILDV